MQIMLNGEPYELPQPVTVLALLERLEIDARLVAVELDRVVVKRARYSGTVIAEGSEVEIVTIVGGG